MRDTWQIPLNLWKGEPCFILGGGPSLRGFDGERLRGRGRVIAVNEAGLTMAPFADVLFWADGRWYDWNKDRLHLHTGEFKVTRCRPMSRSEADIKIVRALPRRMSHWFDALGGWCGGGCAINLAYLLAASPVFLLGFDMHDMPADRWRDGNWHDRHREPPVEGQRRDNFVPAIERMVPHLDRRGVEVYNCNPDSALRCFPFINIEEVLGMDNLSKIERDKYASIWQRPEYRKVSPGMFEWERAHTVFGMKEGESLNDYGAGPARATLEFQRQGLNVLAIDIADNARETDVPFVQASLWDMGPKVMPSDYGFCCDVMEHIPPEKVGDVLQAIADRSHKGAYFRIATRKDRMGPKLLGKPLHLTVQTASWWRQQLEKHWPLVDVVEQTERDVMIIGRSV